MELSQNAIQEQIDIAFKSQYEATLEIASYFDNYGTTLNQGLQQKIQNFENKVLAFKTLCDTHESKIATVRFNGQMITTVKAFSTIGDFVRAVREETKYPFSKLR